MLSQWLTGRLLWSALLLLAASIALICLIIWQITGTWRSLRTQLTSFGGVSDSCVIYLGLFVYLWLLLLGLLDLSKFVSVTPAEHGQRPQTQLRVLATDAGNQLEISGTLEFGLTRRVKLLLNEDPTIDQLMLNSTGGIISEARGVAKVVLQRQLTTHVEHECFSACTLIFIAGHNRTLGHQGQLGFHQYSVDASYRTPWLDPLEQQAIDARSMQQQGIAIDFIERAYTEPHHSLWKPTPSLLLQADVIHSVLTD